MASPSEPGRVRKPSVPRDHGDFKHLLQTIHAWGMVPARRAAGPQSQCLRAVFLQRGARRSCLRPPEQECPSSPQTRMQRADPTGELPKRFHFCTWDCSSTWGSNVGCQVRRAERLPSPPLTCFSVMA